MLHTAIVMNKPSLDKFENNVVEGGKLFINSSLIDRKAERDRYRSILYTC